MRFKEKGTRIFVTQSDRETRALGRQVAGCLGPSHVLCLVGGLGSGKTTFVQGVARGLGVREAVNSPTFALANEYPCRKTVFYHLDLFRLTPQELEAFPLEEYFEAGGIYAIEWAERAKDRWPVNTWEVQFETASENQRRITLRRH